MRNHPKRISFTEMELSDEDSLHVVSVEDQDELRNKRVDLKLSEQLFKTNPKFHKPLFWLKKKTNKSPMICGICKEPVRGRYTEHCFFDEDHLIMVKEMDQLIDRFYSFSRFLETLTDGGCYSRNANHVKNPASEDTIFNGPLIRSRNKKNAMNARLKLRVNSCLFGEKCSSRSSESKFDSSTTQSCSVEIPLFNQSSVKTLANNEKDERNMALLSEVSTDKESFIDSFYPGSPRLSVIDSKTPEASLVNGSEKEEKDSHSESMCTNDCKTDNVSRSDKLSSTCDTDLIKILAMPTGPKKSKIAGRAKSTELDSLLKCHPPVVNSLRRVRTRINYANVKVVQWGVEKILMEDTKRHYKRKRRMQSHF